MTSASSTFGKKECSLRVLRAYKIKLLHSYCKEVMKEAYHDSLKVQAIASCQKLRTLSQFFATEDIPGLGSSTEKAQIFRYETSEYIENFYSAYNPKFKNDS